MAIQFNSLRPAMIPVKTSQSRQAHAGAQQTTPDPPRAVTVKATERETSFRSMLSGGVAAAGAASAAPASVASATNASTSSSAATAGAATAPAATSTAAIASDSQGPVTAEQVFGANPWLTNPTGVGPNGFTFSYNPLYFATVSTAQQVAQMVGGKVVEDYEFTKDTPGDPFAQSQPNEMVELPDGALINPGLIASFYTHGYPISYVNQEIASEVAGAEASVGSTSA